MGAQNKVPDSGKLNESAKEIRRGAEAHMGDTHKDDRARKTAEAEAHVVDAHMELTAPKHSKGLPLPGNQLDDGA